VGIDASSASGDPARGPWRSTASNSESNQTLAGSGLIHGWPLRAGPPGHSTTHISCAPGLIKQWKRLHAVVDNFGQSSQLLGGILRQ